MPIKAMPRFSMVIIDASWRSLIPIARIMAISRRRSRTLTVTPLKTMAIPRPKLIASMTPTNAYMAPKDSSMYSWKASACSMEATSGIS